MNSATVVFLLLPAKTFVGINLSSFTSSPNFHGITNLPPGRHLVYTGTDASLSIRSGRWLDIPPQHKSVRPRIYMLQWSIEHEQLDLLQQNDETTQRVARNLPDLKERGIVDYAALRERSQLQQASQAGAVSNNDERDPWPGLISHISSVTLTRILTTSEWALTSLSSSRQDAEAEHIPGLSSSETLAALSSSTTLNLLPIDLRKTWSDSDVGRTRTERARDRSFYLGRQIDALTTSTALTDNKKEQQLTREQAAGELLGELQFCFVSVLTLANYSCLEQWKRILAVLFTCKSALSNVESFFVEALKVLRRQLERVEDVEGGLFELADESASEWLRSLLRGFRTNVEDVKAQKIDGELKMLDEWLRQAYGWGDERNELRSGMVQLEDGEMVEFRDGRWDEEEETGEYAPVVVET